MLPENTNIELNVSCPNINKRLNDKGIGNFINPHREWCIVKLSPLTTLVMYRRVLRKLCYIKQ